MIFNFAFDATEAELLEFLNTVDQDFPIPISKKMELNTLSNKLYSRGDILIARDSMSQIAGIIAGYLRNGENGLGYISIIAVKKEYRGMKLSERMLSLFLDYCKNYCKSINAIHVYTTIDNIYALKAYRKVGFINYNLTNEPRPLDVHLINYLR